MVLHLKRLQVLARLFLLLNLLQQLARDAVGDVGDVRPTLHGANTIHERALLELLRVRHRHAHLPTIALRFVNFRRVLRVLQIHIDVFREALDFDLFAVQKDLRVLPDDTCGIVHSLRHQRDGIVFQFSHPELLKVWFKRNSGPVVGFLTLGNYRFPFLAHVVLKHLLVLSLATTIARFHDELVRENVRQLCAVTVTTAGDFLFVVVVVGRRQKMSKNKLRDVHAFLFVHLHRDPFPAIHDRNRPFLLVDIHSQLFHRRISDFIICRVDQNLVEDFIQTRRKRDGFLHQLVLSGVVHPRRLFRFFARPDVRVRSQQDVFQLCFLLVNVLDGNFFSRLTTTTGGNVAVRQRRFLRHSSFLPLFFVCLKREKLFICE